MDQYDNESQTFQSYRNKNDRLGFIRKVLGILSVQLTITVAMCVASQLDLFGLKYIMENYVSLMLLFSIMALATSIILICNQKLAKTFPTNWVLLLLFTISESWLVATACTHYDPEIVLLATFMCAAITSSLAIYACTTKTDFTLIRGSCLIFLVTFLLFGILFIRFGSSRIEEIVYSCVGICMYGFYLIMDLQLLVGGHKKQLTYDDYIIGSLMIYVDIIGLFIKILSLLGKKKDQ